MPSQTKYLQKALISVELRQQNRFLEVLPPLSTYEHDLIWKFGLFGCNQIKIRSLGWALIQYHQHCDKKREIWTQT